MTHRRYAPIGHTHEGTAELTWANITGVPSVFPPEEHTHPWSEITSVPATATRWPTWAEVTSKPTTFAPSAHTHPWSEVTGKPSTFPPEEHTHNYLPLSGGTLTGNLTTVGMFANGSVYFNGGGGADGGLRSYKSGDHQYFRNYHHGSNIYFQGEDINGTNRAMLYLQHDGVRLYSGGAIKFNTTTEGVYVTGTITLNSGVNTLTSGTTGSLRQLNSFGYIDIGPMNASWAHIYTDRPAFYFNKELFTLGKRAVTHANTGYSSGNITVSTGNAGGGSDGDIWLKV